MTLNYHSVEVLFLYGVKVDAAEYNKVKRITDLLVGETTNDVPLPVARRKCIAIAMKAMEQARKIKS